MRTLTPQPRGSRAVRHVPASARAPRSRSIRPAILPLVITLLLSLFVPAGRTQSAPAIDAKKVWDGVALATSDLEKVYAVKNLVLQRDRIRLLLDDGTLQFMQPANGVVFGAAFHGKGRLQVSPPNPREAQTIYYFTGKDAIDLTFDQATLNFTDDTFKEVAASGAMPGASSAADATLYKARQEEREERGQNVVSRVYLALSSPNRKQTSFFLAEVNAQGAGWVQARYDALSPEQISVGAWSTVSNGEKALDIWTSFPADNRSASEAFKDPLEKAPFTVKSYDIDATATGNAEFSATTKVNLQTRWAGETVLAFQLDPALRVDAVRNAQGQPLTFFQAPERGARDYVFDDYLVVALPAATVPEAAQTIEFHYAGKQVVSKAGDGNYFCQSEGWYPVRMTDRLAGGEFDTRKDFAMTFHSPKRYTLTATGEKLGESVEGDWKVTKWKSDVPLAVAGFAFGDFKLFTEKANNVDVEVLANTNPDDAMKSVLVRNSAGSGRDLENSAPVSAPLGSLTPAAMGKNMAIETANTVKLFELYFGPYPYSKITVTNIPGSYGQGWPGLVYLSFLSFLDSTQLHTFGVKDISGMTDFFRGHESSHQWWGHKVPWSSYHDQWLSEGFAQFSGNFYTEIREGHKEYLNRLSLGMREMMTGDRKGHALESVAPIWMGARVRSSIAPNAYQPVVYNKGGYVLHMLRMMMQDVSIKTPDAPFAIMMQDFTKTFDGKPASTEDFKAIVERHMNADMDIDGNHRMDWFFNQYVYGTGIARYEFRYSLQPQPDKSCKLSVTLTRSQVPDNWKDVIPMYAQVGKNLQLIGRIEAKTPTTSFDTILPFTPQKISINENLDTLADIKQ